MSQKDQVVLVTGSRGGIGNAAIEALTTAGAIIIGVDRSPKEGQALDAFYPLDITSEQQCAATIQDIQIRPHRCPHPCGGGAWHHPLPNGDNDLRVRLHHADQRIRDVLAGTGDGQINAWVRYSRRHRGPVLSRSQRSPTQLLDLQREQARRTTLAELLGPNGISVNAIAPGPVNTPMWVQFAKDSGPDAAANRAKRAAQLPTRRFPFWSRSCGVA